MQLLDRQAVVDEELRRGIRAARDASAARRLLPKLLGVSTSAGAEVSLPDAVDDDAHRDRLLEDRVGELEPAAAVRKRLRALPSLSTDRKCRGSSSPRIEQVAALADLCRLTGFSASGDAMHERHTAAGCALLQRFDIVAQPVDVAAAIGAQLTLEAPAAEREQPRLDAA